MTKTKAAVPAANKPAIKKPVRKDRYGNPAVTFLDKLEKAIYQKAEQARLVASIIANIGKVFKK